MERLEEGKRICEIFDQLVYEDEEFLNNKTKIYCDYVLSFNKNDDGIEEFIYEKCEDYVKKYHMNKELEMEENFINSYIKKLSKEGKEICKKVDLLFSNNDKLTREKAFTYCNFICRTNDDVDPNLEHLCDKYREKISSFNKYESNFKNLKEYLDMRSLRINLRNK